MIAKIKYSLPVKKEDIKDVSREKSPAHVGKFKGCVDFIVPEGTPIYAAAPGKVMFVKDDSNVGGPDKKYYWDGNAVVIKHNGEHTRYEHLKYKGVVVKISDRVKRGQLVGYSGNTGYTFEPHLHFQVFVLTGPNKDEDFKCLKVKFEELGEK